MNSEIQLNSVMVGIGNVIHDQFHRTNRVDLPVDLANKAAQERFSGGITPQTISQMGIMGGGLGAQHSGVVNIEGGWNQRRGLAMLQMTIKENSLTSQVMTILGYLVGGGLAFANDVPDDVLFVPVRSWTLATDSTQDAMYLPTTRKTVSESSQFLMADPDMMRDLRSIRPVDVINHGFGQLSAEEDDQSIPYTGSTNADLNQNGVIVSKAANLDPLSNATTIMTHAARVSRNMVTHNTLSENMAASMGGISEQEIYQHPFLSMMQSVLDMPSYAGFVGFTFGELRMAFSGFNTVMTKNTDRNIQEHNHTLDSHAMGDASFFEIIANELAFICLHSMIDTGVTYIDFVASNNVGGMGVNNGDIFFEHGICAGVIPNDPQMYNRAMNFKDYIANGFFQKYATKMYGSSTIVEVSVKMGIFSECTVEITLNGDHNSAQRKVFPSYTINRTSSNVASSDAQVSMAGAYVQNLQEYFTRS